MQHRICAKKRSDSSGITPCLRLIVENIGFERRKFIFGEAGIPLK